MDAKANIKDVCALVDSKADTEQVFSVLDEMKRSIQLLSSKVDDESSNITDINSFLEQ